MTFKRTADMGLVHKIVTTPNVYRASADDYSPLPDKWVPVEDQNIWYILAYDDDPNNMMGLFALYPSSAIRAEIHTCLLPHARGQSVHFGQGVLQWIWRNTPFLRVVTQVPSFNRLALRMALNCGLQAFGEEPRCYMKDGELHDVLHLGVSRPTAT